MLLQLAVLSIGLLCTRAEVDFRNENGDLHVVTDGTVHVNGKMYVGDAQVITEADADAEFASLVARIDELTAIFNSCACPKPCLSSPCANGATCALVASGDFACACAAGYTGELCLSEIDECASSPCDPTVELCVDAVASYSCPRRDLCECSPCTPPFVCYNGTAISGYECACPPGTFFDNQSCVDIDECASAPCPSGTSCANGDNRYTCTLSGSFSYSAASTSVMGLVGVHAVGGDLTLQSVSLTSFAGLESVETIGNSFQAFTNSKITNMQGMGNLKSISNRLYLFNMHAITSMEGLDSLETVGDFRVDSCNAVVNFTGLNPTMQVTNKLRLAGDAELVSLYGLNLLTVPDSLVVINHPKLTSIAALATCTAVGTQVPANFQGSSLVITNNAILTNVDGLENIVYVGGDLVINTNPLMADLQGLRGLVILNGALDIDQPNAHICDSLMSHLISIAGSVFKAVADVDDTC